MKKGLILTLAILGWLTISIRLYLRIVVSDFTPLESTLQFFSYFTILTNLLVTIYCTKQLFRTNQQKNALFDKPEDLTALTAFILIVGIVYHIILKPIWNPEGLTMVLSEIHHTIVPLGALVLWFITIKESIVGLKGLLKWLFYPIGYIIWVLIRGSFSKFYPYPFLDVQSLGIKNVLINSLLFLVVMIVILIGLHYLGGTLRNKTVIKNL